MDDLASNNNRGTLAETIKKMADFMDLDCQVEIQEEVDDKKIRALLISIYTPENARFLIGKNGQNLRSLEQVLRAMFLKKVPDIQSIVVDVNDYRRSRANYVSELARQTVMRVRSTQKSEAMLPMSPYERRI